MCSVPVYRSMCLVCTCVHVCVCAYALVCLRMCLHVCVCDCFVYIACVYIAYAYLCV